MVNLAPSPVSVSLTRGTGMIATRSYLEKHHGPDAFTKVLERLSPEHAAVWGGVVVAQGWYPHDAVLALDFVAAALFGDSFYDEIGAYVAEYDLNLIHRFLLRFTNPLWLMDRGAKLWGEYYSSGRWVVERGPTPRSLVGTLSDFAVVNRRQCRMTAGFIRRACQLTGAKDIKLEHPHCRADGARACVFTATW